MSTPYSYPPPPGAVPQGSSPEAPGHGAGLPGHRVAPPGYGAGPVPPMKRGYGALLMVDALCWLASSVLAGMSAVWGVLMLLRTTADQLDPQDYSDSVDSLGATSLAMLLGAGALIVIGVGLDVWMAVASARRLRGDRGDWVIPIIALVAVGLGVVAPALLAVLAVFMAFVDLTQITGILLWCVVALLLAIGPLLRLTQGVAGLVRVATGELPTAGA